MFRIKELYWEPQTGNLKNIVGNSRNIPTRVLICSCIPTMFLRFPLKSLYRISELQRYSGFQGWMLRVHMGWVPAMRCICTGRCGALRVQGPK